MINTSAQRRGCRNLKEIEESSMKFSGIFRNVLGLKSERVRVTKIFFGPFFTSRFRKTFGKN